MSCAKSLTACVTTQQLVEAEDASALLLAVTCCLAVTAASNEQDQRACSWLGRDEAEGKRDAEAEATNRSIIVLVLLCESVL